MAWDGKDFVDLTKILSFDLLETYENLQSDPLHQAARRTWVRTFCSQVEAFLYSTKQLLVTLSEVQLVRLSPEEVMLLKEQSCEVSSKGDIEIRAGRFLAFDRNFRFLAKTASRAGFAFTLDLGGAGWEALKRTFEIRNRLVHPKMAAEMVVLDDELKTVSTAQDWFQKVCTTMLTAINSQLRIASS